MQIAIGFGDYAKRVNGVSQIKKSCTICGHGYAATHRQKKVEGVISFDLK